MVPKIDLETFGDLRILIVDLSKRFGGASMRAVTLAQHLKLGQAAIACLAGSQVMNIARERMIPVQMVGRSRIDILIPFRLRKVIHEGNYQVIDTQNIQSKVWGSLAARMAGPAFVATLNSAYHEEHGASLKGKLYTNLDRWTNSGVDRFIAVSEAIQRSLIDAGLSATRIDLVTNAVISPDPKSNPGRDQVRQELGIRENAFVCTAVGRLVWAKGFDDFIRVFGEVSSKIPNSCALILGEGPLRDELTRQIEQSGLQGRVILAGYVHPDRVMDILKASDVYVMTSRSEGVPIALLEAGAAGLPIVSTSSGGIPEILNDQENALLFPAGDIQGIAAAIMDLYQNPSLACRIGSAARDHVETNYGVSKLITETSRVYQKTLAEKKANLSLKTVVARKAGN